MKMFYFDKSKDCAISEFDAKTQALNLVIRAFCVCVCVFL